MALYSLSKITVLCALFHGAAAIGKSCTADPPPCSGARTERAPLGIYTANNVHVPFHGVVSHVELNFLSASPTNPSFGGHDALYELNVTGCLFQLIPPYKCLGKPGRLNPVQPPFLGYFIDSTDRGSLLIPVADNTGHPVGVVDTIINEIFLNKIRWCPTENHFVVEVGDKAEPYCFLTQPEMMFATVSPNGDTGGNPVQGSVCKPGLRGTCGHGEQGHSGLTCKCLIFGSEETCTCQP